MAGGGSMQGANNSLKNNRRRKEVVLLKKGKKRYGSGLSLDPEMIKLIEDTKLSSEDKAKLIRKVKMKKISRIVIDSLYILIPIAITLLIVIKFS